MRAEVEAFVASALGEGGGAGRVRAVASDPRPCRSPPLAAEEALAVAAVERVELEPKGRERRAIESELEDAAKRDGRRARTESLELSLT